MGRKKKKTTTETVVIRDRIGEPVNMEKCPECMEHPDCFACIKGRCTALNEGGGQGCIFYKPEQQAIQEVQQAYYRLKKRKRHDLIQKYLKTLTALGARDEEFDAGESIMEELDRFAADDFTAKLEAEKGGGKEGEN